MSGEQQELKEKLCRICGKKYRDEDLLLCPDDGSTLLENIEDPLIGQVFADKYEIIGVLGQGGMSVVYKARHRYMDRLVAVKLMLEHLVSDKNAVARFEHESKAASSLSHQNIVTVHDFGMSKTGQAYFVMDCLDGESLADVLERKTRLQVSDAIPIFKQTCDGLEHAHKKRVVHRDLKPSNLVLMKNEDGSLLVKIVDFGIAKLLPIDGVSRQNITLTGEIFGSPLYMSPEQCHGKSLDQRSDIYSLGCLMYETLSGTPPHMGDSFVNTVVKHTQEPAPAFKLTAPEAQIPPQVEACILKCLEKDPDNRYQSVSELRQALLDAALQGGVRGLKAGAIAVTGKGNFLTQTLAKLKLSGPSEQHHAVSSRNRNVLAIAFGFIVLLLGTLLTLVFWPGPDGDRVPNYMRVQWQWYLYWAQEAIKKQDFEQARSLLLEARDLSKQFHDRHTKLLQTLAILADTYGKSGMYAEQEKTNQEVLDLNTQLVLEQMKICERQLKELRKTSDSTVTATMNQLEAEANADLVLSCARTLLARSLFAESEKLLVYAIKTFDNLKLENHQKTADFKLLLAECLMLEQRLSEVRPLLLDALKIREQAPDSESPQAVKRLVKAYLRLGQFDRDQSNFIESKKELSKGLEIAERKLPHDAGIMSEALNSYADLLRQMQDTQGAARYKARADSFNKELMHEADDLTRRTPNE